nr:hypothetical protein [Candidatus Frankia alpina]
MPVPGVGLGAAPAEPLDPVVGRPAVVPPVAARLVAARPLVRLVGTSAEAALASTLASGLGVGPVLVGSPGSATGADDRAVVGVVVFVRGRTSLLGAACSVR